jgi:hypothetical protein
MRGWLNLLSGSVATFVASFFTRRFFVPDIVPIAWAKSRSRHGPSNWPTCFAPPSWSRSRLGCWPFWESRW